MLGPTEKTQVMEIIAGLAETFGRNMSRAGLLAYAAGLKDLPVDSIKQAAASVLRNSRHMPSVAELRELAGEGSVQARAVMAWDAICDAAGRIGSYHSVDFEDAVVNATVRNLGGWPELISKSGDDFFKWMRMEFIKTYVSLSSSIDASSEIAKPLAGLQSRKEGPRHVAVKYHLPAAIRRVSDQQALEEHSQAKAIDAKKPAVVSGLLQLREVPEAD